MTIGIPRALLYYRYAPLWEAFFAALGVETVISPPTNKKIQDIGEALAIDECCLSSKLFFGHVADLIGRCDAVFVPRIADFGEAGIMCPRFEALYDMCANIFRDEPVRFVSCNVDLHGGKKEDAAYIALGQELGASKRAAAEAYARGREALEAYRREKAKETEAALAAAGDQIRVLVVGHEYNLYDEYIGKPILAGIHRLDALPVCADAVDRPMAREEGKRLADLVPWRESRELLGAVVHFHDQVDGIVLITAFPCGPDSMVNEMILRRVTDRPVLNLLLDSQDATAGVETRLESFIDIIRFRGEDRVHGID